jgi:glutathione S-transferase
MLLHWSRTSPYVRKVMVAAHELGLADRLDLRETFPESVVADVSPDNPLAQIPTLVLDDGSKLFDSLVIADYFNDLAGGTLFGTRETRFAVLTRHALAAGLTDRLNARFNEMKRPSAERSPRVMERFAASCPRVYDALESMASGFSTGIPDIGEIAAGVALGYADYRLDGDGWRDGRPALTAWYEKVSGRRSFRLTTPPE